MRGRRFFLGGGGGSPPFRRKMGPKLGRPRLPRVKKAAFRALVGFPPRAPKSGKRQRDVRHAKDRDNAHGQMGADGGQVICSATPSPGPSPTSPPSGRNAGTATGEAAKAQAAVGFVPPTALRNGTDCLLETVHLAPWMSPAPATPPGSPLNFWWPARLDVAF